MNTFLLKLLKYYDLTYEEYQKMVNSTIVDFPKLSTFQNHKEVTNYVKTLIAQKKKILIYGDYDCDGIMSTSIIYLTLLYGSNYKCGYYIPNREEDGYGLNFKNIDRFYKLGYNVFILVDNGISLVEQIDYANSLGIECIILDHHTINNELPKAKYIMHPDLTNLGPYNISAGTVSFYFSWSYLEYMNPYLFSLGAISTLSDVMPLKSYNALMVKIALKTINKYKFSSIFNLQGNTKSELDETDIAITIVPKINSICRILNDDTRFRIVKYFVDNTSELKILPWINEINTKRKELTKPEIENVDLTHEAIYFINNETEGISGLIASNLLNTFEKPVYVMARSKNDSSILKGSARSYENFSIINSLNECKDLLVAYGGHECAGGFSIKEENLDEFKSKIDDLVKKSPKYVKKYNFIELNYNEINYENYLIYRNFAPFGNLHEKPTFRLNDFQVKNFVKLSEGKHLSYKTYKFSIIYFNYPKELDNYDVVSLLCELSLNEFNGSKTVQLKVLDYVK